jgi:hypothetical protein
MHRLSQTFILVRNMSLIKHDRKALSMRLLPQRSRKNTLLTHVINRDKTSHYIMDKICIVMFQEILWFSIVEIGESIINVSVKNIVWCTYDTFTFLGNINGLVIVQIVIDMLC